MTSALQEIVRQLRSGDPMSIHDGEIALLREAGLFTTACRCPDFPSKRSKACYAHAFIAESVVRAETGLNIEDARMASRVKARLREAASAAGTGGA